MKEVELTLRLRNNRLKERRLALGLSQAKLASAVGCNTPAYSLLENMRASPLRKDGRWRKVPLRLAAFFEVDVVELFPPSICKVAEPIYVHKLDEVDVRALTGAHSLRMIKSPEVPLDRKELRAALKKELDLIEPRNAEILRRLYGLEGQDKQTLREIAKIFGISRERVRQIALEGQSKLRRYSTGSRERLEVFIDISE